MNKWKLLFIIPITYIICTIVVNVIGVNRELIIPVKAASSKNWDLKSYWYYPWGVSGIHKGIDIFAPQRTPILSPVNGFITSSGYSNNGGNYVNIISADFRLYYFAHLNTSGISQFRFVKKGQQIGAVGNSGNAVSKPYHLHFSVFSFIPILLIR
ncbi:M23 family metallopeptidase [Pedobacter frigiditerrae]|uniref:M23 family metallopeptidase n=1 Tax=Pedobacter frigiditerrae TaxID=2530452 RepID=UPI00292EB24E|nr:M23 family metallopeptidase [Pedobacter frigiditerrae]